MTPVLSCQNLSITYATGECPVRDVSFNIMPGECFALVGGSGAGKSTIAKALVGLHGPTTRVSGSLRLNEEDLLQKTPVEWRQLRGAQIGYIAQNPWLACNPLRSVADYVAEAWRCHGGKISGVDIAQKLEDLGVQQADMRMRQPPHTWSGGMLQRASIAAANAHSPPLLIADEPTSALDADRAQAVLDILKSQGASILLISHDIELVLRNASRIGILASGRLLETGTPQELRYTPKQSETKQLIRAINPVPSSKPFVPTARLIKARGLAATYAKGKSKALIHADIDVFAGEIVGIQGPSGCGKSTLLRLLSGQERPTGGMLERADELLEPGAVLPVFQDPISSLPPHWPIWRAVSEPLTAGHMPRLSRGALRARAVESLNEVGLHAIDPNARPRELSVGQCQRASLARTLIARPKLIIADEPTSALDSQSTEAVAGLLRKAADAGTAIVIVSHDLNFLQRLTNHIIRMKAGHTLPDMTRKTGHGAQPCHYRDQILELDAYGGGDTPC